MKNWRTAAAKKLLSYVLVLATAMLPFAAQANSLVNDPFVRDAANRRNFEPGGKYHLFGSRGVTTNRKGNISVIPASSQTIGGLLLEQALIRGKISYDVRFSNHGYEVHSPFDHHASRQASDKKGQALIGFTTYQLNWHGHEHHPADGYDGPKGGGFPDPKGARDEYSYGIAGSAARVEVKFNDNRDTNQRFEDRFKNAAEMAANGVKDAWKQATTHNPELNRAGNAAEAVSAAVSGVGSLAGSIWEGIGAGDAAQGISTLKDIAGMEALRALPPEAQLKAVSAMTEAADGYDAANAAYARWAQQNPNAAAVAGAVRNVAEQVVNRGKGAKASIAIDTKNVHGRNFGGGTPAIDGTPYSPDVVEKRRITTRTDLQINQILHGATQGEKTKGRTVQYEKTGGFDKAKEDFDSLEVQNRKNRPNGTITGNLPDGREINVREQSSGDIPTVEIQHGKKGAIKIRYR